MLDLTIQAQVGKAFAPVVHTHLPAAAALLRAPLRELTVVFVNDRDMADLHGRFMNDPTTTDVMTFPVDLDRSGRPVAGEVYVCIPEARRQAKRRGVDVRHEVLLYALHGLLHLCGFDDRTDRDYRRMHRREDDILTRLGIGPVFAPTAAAKTPATVAPRRRRRQ